MDTILYGPQGTGKTQNSTELAKKLGHKKIVDGADEDDIKNFYGKNVLFITNQHPEIFEDGRREFRVIHSSEISEYGVDKNGTRST